MYESTTWMVATPLSELLPTLATVQSVDTLACSDSTLSTIDVGTVDGNTAVRRRRDTSSSHA